MHLVVKKTFNLGGRIISPASKSQSIRGIIFSLLAKGESTLFKISESEDLGAALRICAAFGAQAFLAQGKLTIHSKGLPCLLPANEINTGNSGITTLFTLPLLGLRENCVLPVLF